MIYNTARAEAAPREAFLLEIFLTNRCNMDCSYCSSRYMIDEPRRRALTFEQVRRAVDIFAAYGRKKGRGDSRTVFFTGGEPFLEYETLKKSILYIQAKKERFKVRIATNATLLDQARVDFLTANNVRTFISLDGCKTAHDQNRYFRGQKGSSFDAIVGQLKKIPFEKRSGNSFCVSATLTAETMKYLPESLEFFRRLGIGVVEICPEAYDVWTPARIAATMRVLKKVARDLALRYTRPGERGWEPQFIFSNSSAPDNSKWSLADYAETLGHNISFMYDGYFYPCEAVFGTPLDAAYRVGDAESGVDRNKVKKIYAAALARLAQCGDSVGTVLTAGRYYYAKNRGIEPGAYFENARAVNRGFDAGLGGWLKAQRLHDGLTAIPAFGDFWHQPRLRSAREIRFFRLPVGASSAPASLRAGLDYFLYSPGDRKTLEIAAAPGSAPAKETAEGLAFYALAKAGQLKKKLKVAGLGPAA